MKPNHLFTILASLLILTLVAPGAASEKGRKIVCAHRGASGYLPEHTVAGYALAHGMGADYIEPDLK